MEDFKKKLDQALKPLADDIDVMGTNSGEFGKLLDEAKQQITSATIELIEGLIGPLEEGGWGTDEREAIGRNKLRAQLRQSLKELKDE